LSKKLTVQRYQLYTISAGYAARALIYLACNGKAGPIQVQKIASAESIPKYFLAKILNCLSQKDMVESVKGPGGGFCLSRPASRIKVGQILELFNGVEHLDQICILGLDKCQEKKSCALHKEWKKFRQTLKKRVAQLTIEDLKRERERKRSRIQ